MIRLKNIRYLDDVIEADAYPEDCESAVRFVLHIDTEELEPYKLPEEYSYCSNYMIKAKWHLLNMVKNNKEIPKERLIMWY